MRRREGRRQAHGMRNAAVEALMARQAVAATHSIRCLAIVASPVGGHPWVKLYDVALHKDVQCPKCFLLPRMDLSS